MLRVTPEQKSPIIRPHMKGTPVEARALIDRLRAWRANKRTGFRPEDLALVSDLNSYEAAVESECASESPSA